jgi:BirA family biotin operon repressor/biotin-[acetyl-CoA-carboxylase] ligase
LLETGSIQNGYIDYLNIGIGVNIQNAPEDKICLHHVSKIKLNVPEFLDLLLKKFSDVIEIYRANGFAPIRDEWLSNAYGLNTQIQVRLPNEILLGEFCGLTEFGALELKLLSGETKIIHSGDVFFGWSPEDVKRGAIQ